MEAKSQCMQHCILLLCASTYIHMWQTHTHKVNVSGSDFLKTKYEENIYNDNVKMYILIIKLKCCSFRNKILLKIPSIS